MSHTDTKRFEFAHAFEEFTDYEPTRDGDTISRLTVVERKGKTPYAYLVMKDHNKSKHITIEEANELLSQ